MIWQLRPLHQYQRPRKCRRRKGPPKEYIRWGPDSAARIRCHSRQRPAQKCCWRSSAFSWHTRRPRTRPEWSTGWPLCRTRTWRPSCWSWSLSLWLARSSSRTVRCGIRRAAKFCARIHWNERKRDLDTDRRICWSRKTVLYFGVWLIDFDIYQNSLVAQSNQNIR